jgi:hypothetical protein
VKAQDDLEAAWARLNEELSNLDAQHAPGPVRARTTRLALTRHLHGLADNAAGRRIKCADHPSEWAFNCGTCKSERDGRPPHEHRHPASYPDTPEAARVVNARVLGELGETEREHSE